MRQMLESLFRQEGYAVTEAASAAAALELRARAPTSTSCSPTSGCPGRSGLELVAALRELRPDTPVVLMTAFGSIDTAVDAMRAGAFDYIDEAVPARRGRCLRRESARSTGGVEDDNASMRRAVDGSPSFAELIGDERRRCATCSR